MRYGDKSAFDYRPGERVEIKPVEPIGQGGQVRRGTVVRVHSDGAMVVVRDEKTAVEANYAPLWLRPEPVKAGE